MAGYAPVWQMVAAVIRAGQAYARISGFLPGGNVTPMVVIHGR
jgi:hypothetical protein